MTCNSHHEPDLYGHLRLEQLHGLSEDVLPAADVCRQHLVACAQLKVGLLQLQHDRLPLQPLASKVLRELGRQLSTLHATDKASCLLFSVLQGRCRTQEACLRAPTYGGGKEEAGIQR